MLGQHRTWHENGWDRLAILGSRHSAGSTARKHIDTRTLKRMPWLAADESAVSNGEWLLKKKTHRLSQRRKKRRSQKRGCTSLHFYQHERGFAAKRVCPKSGHRNPETSNLVKNLRHVKTRSFEARSSTLTVSHLSSSSKNISPCHLRSRKPTLPWRTQKPRATFWTLQPQMQLQAAYWLMAQVTWLSKWNDLTYVHQSRCGSQSDWFYIMDHERLSLSLGASLERKSGKVWKKYRKKCAAFRHCCLHHTLFWSSKATNLPVGSSLQHLLWNLLNASTKQQQNEIPRCQNGARRNGFGDLLSAHALCMYLVQTTMTRSVSRMTTI